jgi:epsilon-lactone hydrolase
MKENLNGKPFSLYGRWNYRARSFLKLYEAMLSVSIRRMLRGPRFTNWSWGLETSTYFMKTQASAAFDLSNLTDGREFEDALVFHSPALDQVCIQPADLAVKGDWVQPRSTAPRVTVLYLHGGGFAYYSRAHNNLIALVALAAQARTFALDYRLAPEHPYPAQLEDAQAAYRWLLESGVAPERLVIVGDSAGGNLALALLLSLRAARLPLPALAVCLAPWIDLANTGASMTANGPHDWIQKRMPDRWAGWYCRGADPCDPLISPLHADFRGLPPIYIQAGSAEILLDSIRTLAERAQQQGANVQLEVWPNMTHDFQAFGSITPESRQALQRIGEVVEQYTA